ncbi:MAG: tRNA (adenosine(37)-N6)-threonylcarbamoyltransferase complex transferase subunit TsaD [Burkholderiales bacterium]|nr:tRNA (adenosine(37)-N6)-threonylcarbamoyltransferase complex transferase subunit TsaD [Burkholderiales bacterium]
MSIASACDGGRGQPECLVLGIETSCDETGIALYHSHRGLLAHKLYSQGALHAEYGGVVPELASRDHIQRVLPLTLATLRDASCALNDIGLIAYTEGPGLAGALLVGASVACGLAYALGIPAIGIHHLEGHLLSALLSSPAPDFPFVALLVSGGHSQLMKVAAIGDYTLLGDTVDDAAGEAFDKTAQLLGLGYPGGPALAKLAESGNGQRFKLPRPMLNSNDLNFSFSGLKTAVAMLVRNQRDSEASRASEARGVRADATLLADIAASFEAAIAEVLVAKSVAALEQTGLRRLVVAGGVGANRRLRASLSAAVKRRGGEVYYPPLEFCTDNGAMIALAGAMRALKVRDQASESGMENLRFTVKPRWDLQETGDQQRAFPRPAILC